MQAPDILPAVTETPSGYLIGGIVAGTIAGIRGLEVLIRWFLPKRYSSETKLDAILTALEKHSLMSFTAVDREKADDVRDLVMSFASAQVLNAAALKDITASCRITAEIQHKCLEILNHMEQREWNRLTGSANDNNIRTS